MTKINLHASGNDDYIELLKLKFYKQIEEIRKNIFLSTKEKKIAEDELKKEMVEKINISKKSLF
ncbi:hypothetical protein [Flavobacterium macrobrachii]|jgi:hypothetical protein|uniref:hypothetical protein n=1 Tax=Flavobacterium macrobrachii TaxID=591204 RepID=UPI0037BE6934